MADPNQNQMPVNPDQQQIHVMDQKKRWMYYGAIGGAALLAVLIVVAMIKKGK